MWFNFPNLWFHGFIGGKGSIVGSTGSELYDGGFHGGLNFVVDLSERI